MIRRFALILLGVSVLAGSVLYFEYARWSHSRYARISEGAQIAQTSVGPIEYSQRGTRDPVLLYVHGTPGGHDLAPDSFPDNRVIAPSRPGYLRTPQTAGRTPMEQAGAYAALLDELGIGSVLVVGTSGGGPSAIAFAGAYADRTLGLIALEAVSQPMDTSSRLPIFLNSDFLYWLFLGTLSRLKGVEGLVEMQVRDPVNRNLILEDPTKVRMFEAQMWSMWPVSQRRAGWENDMLQGLEFQLPLERITAPTLIIHGSDDSAVRSKHAELLAKRIQGAELHIIEGADHNMPITHKEEVDAIVEEFLGRHRNDETL